MVLIYADHINHKIRYAFDFIFNARGVVHELTCDLNAFQSFDGTKLSYSTEGDIQPAGFISTAGVTDFVVERSRWKQHDCLSFDGVTDPVASVFYILTRYEEYNSKARDKYGRFPFQSSVLGTDWIEKAVCDRWSVAILLELALDVPNAEKTTITPTFDIDNAFAYRLKSGVRASLSKTKDWLGANRFRIKERRAVKAGGKDPYDTYDRIREIQDEFPSTRMFWLIGKWSKKDRNIGVGHPEHQALIQRMDHNQIVGLHPSFASLGKSSIIRSEKKSLEEILARSIEHSRQHFLRFRLPETFRQLHAMGFKNEYSMGFAEHVGFRCGTARSIPWYDLEKDEATDFMIHPFIYMDGTLREYMRLSIKESKSTIERLFQEVQQYGGDFRFIWHNETIGNYGLWKGWQDVLNHTLTLGNANK